LKVGARAGAERNSFGSATLEKRGKCEGKRRKDER
jgi:hypothetical protein